MKSTAVTMKDVAFEVNSITREKSAVSKVWFIWFFVGTTLTSLAMVYIFWLTSIFKDTILANLELKNGTQTFAWWERSPLRPVMRVRIFNYTNLEEYHAGNASKLRVEELGPYIYRETLTKVNVHLTENDTVTYQENVSHTWEGGRPDTDVIRVPNFPLMAAVREAKEANFVTQLGLTMGLSILQAEPFKVLTVKEYLWGYSDNLVDTVKNLLYITKPMPYDKCGLLVGRSGTSKDRITVHTGAGDLNKLGMYERLNGMKSHNIWGDESCDKIEGTDGSMFPPNLVEDPEATLNIYTRELCRKFPIRYQGQGTSFDIPSLRYKPVKDIFTASNTTNSCFCQRSSKDTGRVVKACPPAGIFNASPCSYGVPVLMSFPHFYGGERSLQNQVDGLSPQQELHETYVDLHPRLGVFIGGWSRMQINVQVSVVPTIPVLEPLKDGMILPIIWIEIGIDSMPERLLSMLWHAYYTAGAVEGTLQWGSLLCTLSSMLALAFLVKKHRDRKLQQECQLNSSLKRDF